ncbi:MAG TPA: hypothetical protein VLX31_00935 [Streptosporangiaceae bacterium]|nr:hypothetical protein [Streptosporangiaceae bacterium]
MPKRFTRAFLATSVAAVVASGLCISAGAATASTHAPKDTAACGFNCISIFSRQLGSGTTLNAYVPGDTGTGGKVGQKVNMHLAANYRPNGDWEASIQGFVFSYCGFLANDFFSPTSTLCQHYAFAPLIELSWSPFGNQTTLCAGVAKGGVAGESVTLQACGQTGNTLWVADTFNRLGTGSCLAPVSPLRLPVGPNSPPGLGLTFCPLINGGDASFSQPQVLTLNTGTQKPTNQLMTMNESKVGGAVRGNQLFAFFLDPPGGV